MMKNHKLSRKVLAPALALSLLSGGLMTGAIAGIPGPDDYYTPAVLDDHYDVPFQQVSTFDVLANDVPGITDEIDPSTLVLLTPNGWEKTKVTEAGKWEVKDGKVTLTPNRGYVGDSYLTYKVADKGGRLGTATLYVRVDMPKPMKTKVKRETAIVNTPLTIDVLKNVTAVDGAPVLPETLKVRYNDPSQGTWVPVDGKFVFTPAQDFKGKAWLYYEVSNSLRQTVEGEVLVDVVSGLPVPKAKNDYAYAKYGHSATLDVLKNDKLNGTQVAKVEVQSEDQWGNPARVIDGNKILWENWTGFFGTTSVVYTVTATNGEQSKAHAVIEVQPYWEVTDEELNGD